MPKASIVKLRKPGKKNIYFDAETATDAAYIIENDPSFNISSAVKEGIRRVKKSIERKKGNNVATINQ